VNDSHALSASIKAAAREVGFVAAGVTRPDPPPHLDVFEAWLASGRQGEMHYLGRPAGRFHRQHPRTLLPECRSILVVAAAYAPPAPSSAARPPQIAAYARGQDYHAVLESRLRSLVARIEELNGGPFAYRIFCDTGPLLERELAQRAGLGWIGKNTCLIDPERGSYLLLAEVLLGLDLEADPPFAADRCGTCTRCVDACPTACILPDRTLDATRCISYWTIELRGSIPRMHRQDVAGWLFGCDICQDVCPWNLQFSSPTSDPAFQPTWMAQLDGVETLLGLDPEQYARDLAASPLRRAKLSGLLRNAAVVAGNQRSESAVPGLAALMTHADPVVREHAAWALGRIGSPDAIGALQRHAGREQDPRVREEIALATSPLG
jgi:epoxyqueuosine reductase